MTANAQIRAKQNVLGIMIDPTNYEDAVVRIVTAAKEHKPCIVSALAVHGTMTGVLDPTHRYRLNRFDLLVPDGQPVRWALNCLHRSGLKDRVYGPQLTVYLLDRAAKENIPIYLYGTTQQTLDLLQKKLHARFPGLIIAGAAPSRFRQLSPEERSSIVEEIRSSGARMLFAALGCPRQEVWAYEHRNLLSIPIVAIGAAFPFLAGTLPQAPPFMQRLGLEWLFRLIHEPARLWRRYILLNPAYLCLLGLQTLGKRFDVLGRPPDRDLLLG